MIIFNYKKKFIMNYIKFGLISTLGVLLIISINTCKKDSLIEKEYGYVVAFDGAPLLDQPYSSGNEILNIPIDSKLEIINKLNSENLNKDFLDWYEVLYLDKKWYVYWENISFNEPLPINPSNSKIYNAIKEYTKLGILENNNQIKLGMDFGKIIELLGQPKKIGNGEWRGYLDYDNFAIGFNDYLFEDFQDSVNYNQTKKLIAVSFFFPCKNMKITAYEIINELGKPKIFRYNDQMGGWEIIYKINKNYLTFATEDINAYVSFYEILEGK